MLSIILGIIVAIALMFFFDTFTTGRVDNFAVIVIIFVLLSGLAIGLVFPVSGYTDWEQIDEIELVSLSNSLGTESSGFIYVSLSANNVYTYRYEVESQFGTNSSKEYKTGTLSNNVTEVEDPNCDIPVLRIYERSGRKTIWTFAFRTNEYSYVFYVPEGSIAKEIKLD